MPAIYMAQYYRDHIAENFPDVSVRSDDPSIRPPKLLVLTQVPAGGSALKQRFLTWRCLIAQWWLGDDAAGGAFGEELRDLVVDSPYALRNVHKIKIVGEPGRFDDPEDTVPRFQMTWNVLTKVERHN